MQAEWKLFPTDKISENAGKKQQLSQGFSEGPAQALTGTEHTRKKGR